VHNPCGSLNAFVGSSQHHLTRAISLLADSPVTYPVSWWSEKAALSLNVLRPVGHSRSAIFSAALFLFSVSPYCLAHPTGRHFSRNSFGESPFIDEAETCPRQATPNLDRANLIICIGQGKRILGLQDTARFVRILTRTNLEKLKPKFCASITFRLKMW